MKGLPPAVGNSKRSKNTRALRVVESDNLPLRTSSAKKFGGRKARHLLILMAMKSTVVRGKRHLETASTH